MPKVSVIIAIYNVEAYIERCLHSLFSQTLNDIEYIFVDDATPDSSIELIYKTIDSYPSRRNQIKVLRHACNRGLAAARAAGMRAATGDYIISCDPDDYIELDMYEKMYYRAVETCADIILCSFWFEWQDHKQLINPFYDSTPQKYLNNLCNNQVPSGVRTVWNKLVRRELVFKYDIFPYKNIDHGDDFNCVVRFLYYAKSMSVLKEPLYHYCQRKDSMSAFWMNGSMMKVEMYNIDLICQFLQQNSGNKYRKFCNHTKFLLKRDYKPLFNGKDQEWFNLYRECHRDILRLTSYPLKSRIILFAALQNYSIYKILKTKISGL